MIKYMLICRADPDGGGIGQNHVGPREFECWFPSSAAYDAQAARGLVVCPICDSPDVAKAIMAPSIARPDKNLARRHKSRSAESEGDRSEAETPKGGADDNAHQTQEVAIVDDRLRHLHAMVRELRAKIISETRDVGADFPVEARKMHAGETIEAPIRGQASPEDARALLEEGIAIMPIPVLPEDRN